MWSEYNPVDSSLNVMHTTTNSPNSTSHFFQRQREKRNVDEFCDCPLDQEVSSTMTVDLSADGHTQLIFFDTANNALSASDMSACKCVILLITTKADRKGKHIYHTRIFRILCYYLINFCL